MPSGPNPAASDRAEWHSQWTPEEEGVGKGTVRIPKLSNHFGIGRKATPGLEGDPLGIGTWSYPIAVACYLRVTHSVGGDHRDRERAMMRLPTIRRDITGVLAGLY